PANHTALHAGWPGPQRPCLLCSATTETQQSAQTVLIASESVEEAAANLRSEVESFLTKVAV
ncbi:MAG TPA: hypothetical protein VF396_04410, partial [Bradyrhizobium sp.]